jgi:predicted PurR-regulated permease PerM
VRHSRIHPLHSPTRSDQESTRPTTSARTVALVVIAVGVTVFLLQQMEALFAPLAVGVLLFCALDPIVDGMERWRIPRWIGAAIALGTTVAVLGVAAWSLQDEALTVVNELPAGAKRITAMLERRQGPDGPLEKVEQAAAELQKTNGAPSPGVMRVQVEAPPVTAPMLLWSRSSQILSALNQFVIILFLTYFILLSDKMFRRKFVELAGPTLRRRRITIEIIDGIATQMGRFILALIFTGVIVGIATWLALTSIGLRQAPLWGLVAGVLNSIPYYGPLLVSSVLAMVGFLQFGTIGMMFAAAGIALAITSLEGWLLTPVLMGKVASMNRVAVFVGLLFWTWAWGVWGMLLAIPMMMIIKVICDHVEDLKPVGKLLGE